VGHSGLFMVIEWSGLEAWDIVLYSWASCFTHRVLLSTQLYEWMES